MEKESLTTQNNTIDPFIDSDTKDIEQIIVNGEKQFIVVSNNAPLQIFSY